MNDKKRPTSNSETFHISGRTIRKVNPLGLRVLVELDNDGNRSDGGLYLPEGSKDSLSESIIVTVREVARAKVSDHLGNEEEANVSGIPEGAKVLIRAGAGVKVPWSPHFRIVETNEVLALIEESLLN